MMRWIWVLSVLWIACNSGEKTVLEIEEGVSLQDNDGDGDIDVLSASRNDDMIAWYENDGGANPSFTKAEFGTDNVPPNVIDPEVVTVPDNVRPLTVPVPPTDVTVPEPKPVAAMLILPAPLVTVIFEPPVIVANTGSPPVEPIGI